MLLIACSLALLVMYAGVKLLAQIQRESLGHLYKYFSWVMITMGFLMLICIGCFAIMRCCRFPEQMMEKRMKMMEERSWRDRMGMEEHMNPYALEGREDRGYYDGFCDGMQDGKCDKRDEVCKKDTLIGKPRR